jgi:hypothetical protein
MRHTLTVPFELRGTPGEIHVAVLPNVDPVGWGCHLLSAEVPGEAARGFPVCEARIEFAGKGYAAVCGWIQFVRSSDSPGDPQNFELDPTTIYRDVETPYAWYGVKPILFDAPFRTERYPMRWRARSFLCFSPDAVMTRQACLLAGFGWGFDVVSDEIAIKPPVRLASSLWDTHLEVLRDAFPSWRFQSSRASG